MDFDWDELEEDATKNTPVFVGWYSGGFPKDKGAELLRPLMQAIAREVPAVDTLVLHFPDAYDIQGLGTGPWEQYVDLLVEEIDSDPKRRGRPLVLFGHSRGSAPVMSVASRLGQRALRVYIASSDAPVVGEPSPFQLLSERFQIEGDIGLLRWFVSLQPGNRMMAEMCRAVEDGELDPNDGKNPFLTETLTLMRRQYKDAIFPDMSRDCSAISCPIVAFRPELDSSCSRAGFERWKQWTSVPEASRAKLVVGATHMNVLSSNLVDGKEESQLINYVVAELVKLVNCA